MEVIIKEEGLRLDKALADLSNLSRSQANQAIKDGSVLVNGRPKKAKYSVKGGDVISFEEPEEEVLDYQAENLPLKIVYEDQDLAVVSPRGWWSIPLLGTALAPSSMPFFIILRTYPPSTVLFVQVLSIGLTRTPQVC